MNHLHERIYLHELKKYHERKRMQDFFGVDVAGYCGRNLLGKRLHLVALWWQYLYLVGWYLYEFLVDDTPKLRFEPELVED